jgi:hypothetical protein
MWPFKDEFYERCKRDIDSFIIHEEMFKKSSFLSAAGVKSVVVFPSNSYIESLFRSTLESCKKLSFLKRQKILKYFKEKMREMDKRLLKVIEDTAMQLAREEIEKG